MNASHSGNYDGTTSGIRAGRKGVAVMAQNPEVPESLEHQARAA